MGIESNRPVLFRLTGSVLCRLSLAMRRFYRRSSAIAIVLTNRSALNARPTAKRFSPSDVMRIIKPEAAAHASDEPIINTWLRNQRSEHTRGVYRRDTAKLLRFTGKPLRAITLDDLQAFSADLARQGLAPISVGRTLAAVRSLMRFANRSGHLAKNVAADLNLPRSENRLAERILGEEDAQRMIALETKPRNRVLMLLLYTAGLRVSEACNLRGRNLRTRGDTGQLTIYGKGGKTRAILLPAAMWQDLLSLDTVAIPDAPVFRSRTGKALDRSRVLRIVQEAAERAGVDGGVSPHWLRHYAASRTMPRNEREAARKTRRMLGRSRMPTLRYGIVRRLDQSCFRNASSSSSGWNRSGVPFTGLVLAKACSFNARSASR